MKNYVLLAILGGLALTFFGMAMVKIIVMKEEMDASAKVHQTLPVSSENAN
jgi:hypothetical protein